jgi:hypothetical protein
MSRLKCNRQHPCDNCIKRSDVDSCTYAAPAAKKRNSVPSPAASGPDEMQNRIDRLENLVLSLMTNGPQSAGPTAATAALAQTTEAPAGPASSVSGSSSFPVDTEDTNHDDMEFGDDHDAEVNDVAKSIGVMKVDSGKVFYASEAHWYSILAEVQTDITAFIDGD